LWESGLHADPDPHACEVDGEWKQELFVIQLLQHRCDRTLEKRQVLFYHEPYSVLLNAQIIMHQHIAETRHLAPIDFGMC
jgi:hypothetical protein